MDPFVYMLMWTLLFSPFYLTCAFICYGVFMVTKNLSTNSPVATRAIETASQLVEKWLAKNI